eukprot:TRINITY_DN8810_c0_g1_i1.p2 TRINITY_DN8810_c0_g1~~TRINITY_DN8810_c0_g1_i1.p2  ORF type:complete len:53 (+),score=5.29 TRINITY_DN8810_c0_g1_i1:320-478(+)
MRADDETHRLEDVPISPDNGTHEGCTTIELHEEKYHRSRVTTEGLQDLESTM